MDAKLLGRQIQNVRIAKGIKQVDLADVLDISPKYLSNIESGFKTPSFETFIAIANSLQIDANTLLAGNVSSLGDGVAGYLSAKLERLPEEEQRRLIHLFEVIVDDAIKNN